MAKVVTDSWVMGRSKNIKRSVAFYAKLGLKPSMQMPFYVEFNLPGGTALGLHAMDKKRTKKRSHGDGLAIMLRVKGIERHVAGLKRKGVRCSKIWVAPGGAKVTNLSDPDGNALTLLEMA